MSNDRFVNPYNFVPLEDKCSRNKFKDDGELTGYIQCELENLTPLFIPNTSNEYALKNKGGERFDKSYNFFSYRNLAASPDNYDCPVIPGSEIRGAVRSVFEAAFNGCLSQVNLKESFHRRSMQPKKPGFLRKTSTGWEIEPCERVMLNTTKSLKNTLKHGEYVDINRLEEGQKILVKKSKQPYITGKGFRTKHYVAEKMELDIKNHHKDYELGYVHLGEAFGNKKHHESVFVKKPSKSLPVHENEISLLKGVLRQFQSNNLKAYSKFLKGKDIDQYFKNINEDNNTILVYYSEVKEVIPYSKQGKGISRVGYLSPAMLSQEVFHTTLNLLLEQQGNYLPCKGRNCVCSACALFGLASENGESLASRVRFGDAEISEELHENQHEVESLYDRDMLIQLGEPKPSTVEFYTINQDYNAGKQKNSWTYDYSKNRDDIELHSSNNLKIRGRKFYWHHSIEKNENKAMNSEMTQKIRPLKAKNRFNFKIYFNRITEEELKRLMWSIDFYNGKCAHKIGRGKPLGFGSTKVIIRDVLLRKIDGETGNWSLKSEEEYLSNEFRQMNSTFETSEVVKQLIEIVKLENNFNKGEVSYPKVFPTRGSENYKDNDLASHKWFSENRRYGKFKKVLPTIEEEANASSKNKWLRNL